MFFLRSDDQTSGFVVIVKASIDHSFLIQAKHEESDIERWLVFCHCRGEGIRRDAWLHSDCRRKARFSIEFVLNSFNKNEISRHTMTSTLINVSHRLFKEDSRKKTMTCKWKTQQQRGETLSKFHRTINSLLLYFEVLAHGDVWSDLN